MLSLTTLSTFSIAVLLLLLSPGPNMAFVIAHSASYGMAGGAAAALGIAVADLVLTILTAAGMATLIAAWTPALEVIRYAGALYLLSLAYQALRRPGATDATAAAQTSLQSVFLRSMFNSMLNPKALLFFLVFLPPFVDPHRAPVTQQLLLLGALLTLISTIFHLALGALGGHARQLLQRYPQAGQWQPYGLAAVLLALALRLAMLPIDVP